MITNTVNSYNILVEDVFEIIVWWSMIGFKIRMSSIECLVISGCTRE